MRRLVVKVRDIGPESLGRNEGRHLGESRPVLHTQRGPPNPPPLMAPEGIGHTKPHQGTRGHQRPHQAPSHTNAHQATPEARDKHQRPEHRPPLLGQASAPHLAHYWPECLAPHWPEPWPAISRALALASGARASAPSAYALAPERRPARCARGSAAHPTP